MKQRIAAIGLVLASTACAAGGSPGQPGAGAPLAYAMPPVNPLVYTVADTVSIDMDMGGTFVQVGVQSDATMETSFRQAGGGLEAAIRYTALTGEFSNSMGPSVPISNDDIPEVATVSVAPDGHVTMVDVPEASEAFRQVLGAESAYRRLFVTLPARVVQPGEMWTDTLTTTEEVGGMTTDQTQIVTSTLAGDTVLAGRRLQVIRSDMSGTTRIAGTNQGMEIRQYLNGTSTATTLWDPARRALIERVETGVSEGSMELPTMGVTGVPVRMTARSVIRLQGN